MPKDIPDGNGALDACFDAEDALREEFCIETVAAHLSRVRFLRALRSRLFPRAV